MNDTPFIVDVQFPQPIDTQSPPRCGWHAEHNGEQFIAAYRYTRDWRIVESFRFRTLSDAQGFVAETHRQFETLSTQWTGLKFTTRIWMFQVASQGEIGSKAEKRTLCLSRAHAHRTNELKGAQL